MTTGGPLDCSIRSLCATARSQIEGRVRRVSSRMCSEWLFRPDYLPPVEETFRRNRASTHRIAPHLCVELAGLLSGRGGVGGAAPATSARLYDGSLPHDASAPQQPLPGTQLVWW